GKLDVVVTRGTPDVTNTRNDGRGLYPESLGAAGPRRPFARTGSSPSYPRLRQNGSRPHARTRCQKPGGEAHRGGRRIARQLPPHWLLSRHDEVKSSAHSQETRRVRTVSGRSLQPLPRGGSLSYPPQTVGPLSLLRVCRSVEREQGLL